jgi:hypothetical protein
LEIAKGLMKFLEAVGDNKEDNNSMDRHGVGAIQV